MQPPEVTDEQLVGRLKAKDALALRDLMERHRRPLYGYLLRMLSSREDAEDLFQETFLRVVRHAERFDERRSFRPWLYAIATNLVKNKYRSRGYRDAVSLDRPDEQGTTLAARLSGRGRLPGDEVVLEETRETVREFVERLPERGRAALVLYYYQGLSYQEVAETLDIPLGTVKSRIHNALARLAKDLSPREEVT